MSMEFTPTERAILRIVQKDIPDSLTPFADIAARVGCAEEDVLNLLIRLREAGVIRRFGASIKHQRTGWTSNAMVAWKAGEAQADAAGAFAVSHPRISHCYYRPSPYPDWPYTFYTMVHGRSAEDCLAVVEEIRRSTPLESYEILNSIKELKKISMTYFNEPDGGSGENNGQ
ncbi:MAG: Lrp/AsnC family transcriptional regulator [Mailhella sp.]|nr:Lrp/AsnC family transcriptional regulator [Mailhella sp.]